MPVGEGFRRFALEQLGRVVPGGVRARAMFGGFGVYAGERFFALLAEDTVYLKADDVTRAAFAAEALRPFMPFGDETHVMSYYELPADWLEDAETLRPWTDRALEAADRARRKRPPKPPQRSSQRGPKRGPNDQP